MISILMRKVVINRGVGTGETSEARASPEIRGYLKSNKRKKICQTFIFLGVSPEITLFLHLCFFKSLLESLESTYSLSNGKNKTNFLWKFIALERKKFVKSLKLTAKMPFHILTP